MATDFAKYLRSKGYAKHVVDGGLAGLVRTWESTADGLARADPAYIMYEEFLNDVDGRRILRECMDLAEADELEAISARVAVADQRFKDLTISVPHCVWGQGNEKKYGYTPGADWYYYRRPKVIDDSWPDQFYDTAA